MHSSLPNEQPYTDNLKLLADFWTLRIIDSLQRGELRYCEIQRRIDNLNPTTLSGRLKKLEQANIISRQIQAHDKISVSYELTQLGREVLPIIQAINQFSRSSKPTIQ